MVGGVEVCGAGGFGGILNLTLSDPGAIVVTGVSAGASCTGTTVGRGRTGVVFDVGAGDTLYEEDWAYVTPTGTGGGAGPGEYTGVGAWCVG
jgi:hypothetical protein